MSFAQFEREVIGERVRDKIAASKRKGIWVGGPVPLGYRCIDKKLVLVPEEAEAVRTIFGRYLALGSLGALIEELDRRGIKTKVIGRADGPQRGGILFGVGSLAHLLKNRFYIGEVAYQGEVHRGEHAPILDRDLLEAVQAKLAANATVRQVRLRGAPAILTGRIFDDRGNRMSPTHSDKLGVRYRYYVSHALLQQRSGRLRVLFMSGYTENAIVHHGRLDDGVPLIGKLFEREQLAMKVAAVLWSAEMAESPIAPVGQQDHRSAEA